MGTDSAAAPQSITVKVVLETPAPTLRGITPEKIWALIDWWADSTGGPRFGKSPENCEGGQS